MPSGRRSALKKLSQVSRVWKPLVEGQLGMDEIAQGLCFSYKGCRSLKLGAFPALRLSRAMLSVHTPCGVHDYTGQLAVASCDAKLLVV